MPRVVLVLRESVEMLTLDRHTREVIAASIREAVAEVYELYNEEWLTGRQLCEQVGFFTPDWLKRYGQLLPRERVGVLDDDGEHRTGWCYPKKKILRMIQDGRLRSLRLEKR